KSGTYSLTDLLTEGGDKDAPDLLPTKTLRKTCRLSNGTFIAEINASKGISARGLCGGEPPSVVLSLRKNGSWLTRNLVFSSRDCLSTSDTYAIHSLTIRSSKKEIIFLATAGGIPIQKIFPIKHSTT